MASSRCTHIPFANIAGSDESLLHPSERRTFKAIQIEVVKLWNPFIILEKLVATNVASTDIIL